MYPPLITIAMPVYNAGKYLRPAVLSILNQTITNWELIIIDDGSTDGCLMNISDLDDERIITLKDGENKGISERLNEIILLARGEYFARMDADDISLPERLSCQLSFLKKDKSLDIVACRVVTIDAENNLLGELPYRLKHEDICSRPWVGFYVAHPTWFGKLNWFKRHQYATENYCCEDQELLLRSFPSSQFATVDKVLFQYRLPSKFNFSKRVKTNFSFLRKSAGHFIARKQYNYVVLSFGVFVLRLFKAIGLKVKSYI